MLNLKCKINSERGGIELLVLAVVVLASIMLVGGSFKINKSIPPSNGQAVNIQDVQPGTAQNTLQISGLATATPVPIPPPPVYQPPPVPGIPYVPGPPSGSSAPLATPAPQACGIAVWGFTNICGNGCVMDGPVSNQSKCCPGVGGGDYNGRTQYWCDAKPVIYLYPTKPTNVSVKVTIPGKITVSIPQYDQNEGWKNVLAYPNGDLIYKNNKYSELFYETIQERTTPPATGWVVKMSNLKAKLTVITTKLGLKENEQNEFLAYWLPRLKDLNKPYVFVSVFTGNEKQSIDKVDISPKPDTFIEFIMYYKGVDAPFNIKPLELPQNIPQRTGFTAVEWGGILDY